MNIIFYILKVTKLLENFFLSFLQPIGLYSGKYEWAARPGSGDCSLNLIEVDIKFDDGLWECQVTASTFESQDALASKPARLVVRGNIINTSIYLFDRWVIYGSLHSVTRSKNCRILTIFKLYSF
jgi:hypothetical protein